MTGADGDPRVTGIQGGPRVTAAGTPSGVGGNPYLGTDTPAKRGTISQSVDPILDIAHTPGIVWDMPADPLLVVRRHVDFLRVRSAICCDAC